MVDKRTIVIAGALLVLGAGATLLTFRLMNQSLVIHTRLEVPDVGLSDGNTAQLIVNLTISIDKPSNQDTHAFVSKNAERIARQSAQQVLSPYAEEDISAKQEAIVSTLTDKLLFNMKKAGYNASHIIIDLGIE